MRKSRLTALGLSAMLALSACGTGGSADEETGTSGEILSAADCVDPAAATEKITGTLKVGWSAPLSGPLATAVGAVIEGMNARFAVANEAGGVDGVKIEIIAKDDAFNPEKAKANGLELIQKDGVHVLETFGSGQINAMADDQNEACVPLLFAQASLPEYKDARNFPWTTEYLPEGGVEMRAVVEQLRKKYPDGVEVALAVNQTESGQSYANGLKAAIEGTNITIVKEAPLTDPNAAATTLKESGAKVLVDAGVAADCLSLTQAVGRSGWKPETFVQPANCVDGATLYAPAGDAADGQQVMVWLKDPGNPLYKDDSDVREYLAAVEKHGAKAPLNNYTVNGWSIADLMVDAFTKAAGSEDGLSRLGIAKAARTQTHEPSMFIDGVRWTMTVENSLGISGFKPFAWSAEKRIFEEAGDVIDVSGS